MNIMAKWHNFEQKSEKWESLRQGKITSFNFNINIADYDKPVGETAKKYALKSSLERIKNCKSENNYANAHTKPDHEPEPIAKKLYEDLYFTEMANSDFFDWRYYGDNPDELVGNHGVIKIKSIIDTTHHANLICGAFDLFYKWQIVSHLDCTNCEMCEFISYCVDFHEKI